MSPNWLRMMRCCCAILLTVLLSLWGMGQVQVVLASPSAQEAGPTMGPLRPLPLPPAAVGAVLARLRSDLARVDQYHVALTCWTMGTPSHTEAWRKGDLLALVMTADLGMRTMGCRVVFDGTWQHADVTVASRSESGPPAQRKAVRISLAGTTLPGRPFDTLYDLSGTGLGAGDDVCSTVLGLLDLCSYRLLGLREFGGEPCLELEGTVDPVAAARRCRARFRQEPRVFLDSVITIYVSRSSGRVRGWRARKSAESKESLHVVQVDWKDDAPTAAVFAYTPPVGMTPQDVTQTVKLARAVDVLDQFESVKFLVGRDRTLLECKDNSGRTLLHLAASADPVVVSWLVSQGACVNVRDSAGSTPLHEATLSGNVPVVRVLVGAEADVKASNRDGSTPLHTTAMSYQKGAAEAIIPLLLARGAAVNQADSQGRTPLHQAAEGIAPASTVRAFLGAGANRALRDSQGKTAFDLASTPEKKKLLQP